MEKVIRNISDIQYLPSVLDIEWVNVYMNQLLDVINNNRSVGAVEAARAINELIGYQGQNLEGLSVEVSCKILDWIKKNYDSDNIELVDFCSANLANLTCLEAKSYLGYLIEKAKTEYERNELLGALSEIDVRG